MQNNVKEARLCNPFQPEHTTNEPTRLMIARLKHGDCVRSEEVVNCAVQWQVLEFGVNFMEPDYLQLQIKSVILHLYSTLALPSWHGNSVSIQLTMFFQE